MRGIERQYVVPGEDFAERVERAGADIAEDDADGADRELEEAVTAVVMAGRDSPGRSAHR